MINREKFVVIEMMMTDSEQVELTRLEDEVSDAQDHIEFIYMDKLGHIDLAQEDLIRCNYNLNNYIAQMIAKYPI